MRSIDYTSSNPVYLSIDSSFIAVGIILSQIDDNGKRCPARYGSLPMGDAESRYSQPKLELYGLFRALQHYRLHIIGVQNLHVEVDAKYIKGMLNEPDLQPNATINRWIQGILLFDFTLHHVPATSFKGPDGLSQRSLASDEEIIPEDDSWLDDIALFSSITKFSTLPYNSDKLPSIFLSAADQEQTLTDIYKFLTTLEAPSFESTAKHRKFVKRTTRFFCTKG